MWSTVHCYNNGNDSHSCLCIESILSPFHRFYCDFFQYCIGVQCISMHIIIIITNHNYQVGRSLRINGYRWLIITHPSNTPILHSYCCCIIIIVYIVQSKSMHNNQSNTMYICLKSECVDVTS